MAVPKKKVTLRRKRNRRSHDAIKPPALTPCPHCNTQKLPHRPCPVCGKYKGRVVLERVR